MEKTKKWSITKPEQVKDLQAIVKVLTDFDEKTGRSHSYLDLHYARKVISECTDITALKFIVETKSIAETTNRSFVYDVTAKLDLPGLKIITSWIHEDGIAQEKEQYKDNPKHPVHRITSLTDILNRN